MDINLLTRKIVRIFKRNRHIFYILLFALLSIAFINLVNWDISGIFSSREAFQEFIQSFGAWGPIILTLLIALEVIIAPIPGFIPALTSGFIFGHFFGALYVFMGNVLGTLLLFFLVRKYGKLLVNKLFKKKKLEKYEQGVERHENWLLVFYFIPLMPFDIITAAFGLSAVKVKKFVLVIIFGYLFYSIILAFFGDMLAQFLFIN
jgi:uncharacterized membrane protein YdjX (TVP38/TMEM64 family)